LFKKYVELEGEIRQISDSKRHQKQVNTVTLEDHIIPTAPVAGNKDQFRSVDPRKKQLSKIKDSLETLKTLHANEGKLKSSLHKYSYVKQKYGMFQ
jgi:hypothetical protein